MEDHRRRGLWRAAGQLDGLQDEEGGGGKPDIDAGNHVHKWDIRYLKWTGFEGRIFWAAGNDGPVALPGRYTVRMTVDGVSHDRDFEILMNPRAAREGVTMADLEERFDLAMRIRDRVSEANEAVIRIRRIKEQVDDRVEASDEAAIDEMGETVNERLSGVEGEIYQVRNRSNQDPLNFPIKLNNKLAALLEVVEGAESRPTDPSYTVLEHLNGLLDAELEQMELISRQDVARLNELLREAGLEPVRTENLIT